jgi:glycyl-tRNA synthetase
MSFSSPCPSPPTDAPSPPPGLWLERREEQGYPLGLVAPADVPKSQAPAAAATAGTAPRTFVLEIGSEELPPDDVLAGMAQLRERVPALLQKLRLSHGPVAVHGTPRRLAVVVPDLAARQAAQESRVRGPPAKAAFGADGKPTKVRIAENFRRRDALFLLPPAVEARPCSAPA